MGAEDWGEKPIEILWSPAPRVPLSPTPLLPLAASRGITYHPPP